MKFKGIPTTLGSVPFKSAPEAVKLLFKYTPELPAWPQLPKRSFKENMYAQFSENFPGIIVNEKEETICVDTQKAFNSLEMFYEHYLSSDWDYFSISEGYAAGFYELKSQISNLKSGILGLKCQITGPLTYGLTVKDEKGQAIFYNEQLKDVVLKHIASKSLWQIKQISNFKFEIPIILSLDEPYLAAYGSAFTAISREDVINSLSEVIQTIKNNAGNILISVHCCANTDWSVLIDSGVDILSFDAYNFFDSLLLYKEKMKHFIDKGGILACGIIPTNEEQITKENPGALADKLKKDLEKLSAKGIDKNKLYNQILITPACGLGSLSSENAEKALMMLSETSANFKS
ncbi:MAG: methionine synthase [Elusimicrobia bacterium]|nr:methionine synthase [Elusimicrobiota bacterium]MBU2614317.1 methionine synthase [Elusimicrobiota bacterium]